MPPSNVIFNGNFNLGGTGWNGTDTEFNPESAYLGNGSNNTVSEIDGRRGQVTVLQQTVTIPHGVDTELTFRTALRTASLKNAATDGFRVEIVSVATGAIIAVQTYLPGTTAWTQQTLPVSFPTGGQYIIRLIEVGVDDSLGAIVDDIALLVCFGAGTLIDTEQGPRAVETLTAGDRVWTQDAGFQPITWIGRRTVSVADQMARPELRPIVFPTGSLGQGMPTRDLTLSPQHRLCLGGWQADLHFAAPQVLVAAHRLAAMRGLFPQPGSAPVTYVHFLLHGHQIVRSNGVLTESFFPAPLALQGLDRDALTEVLDLFPDLADLTTIYANTARPVVRGSDIGVFV